MFQFLDARLSEAEDLAALRIDAGHQMPDGAVLAAGVHPLKDQQQSVTVGGVVKALQRTQFLHVLCKEFLVLILRLANRLHDSRPFCESYLFSGPEGRRDHVLLAFLHNTGARIQEALDLSVQARRLESPFQVRLFGKGKKEQIRPLWPETVELLKALLKRKPWREG